MTCTPRAGKIPKKARFIPGPFVGNYAIFNRLFTYIVPPDLWSRVGEKAVRFVEAFRIALALVIVIVLEKSSGSGFEVEKESVCSLQLAVGKL